MAKKVSEICAVPLLLLAAAVLLLRGAVCANAAYSAMQLSAKVVIPTLFPFSVLAGILVRSGIAMRLGIRFGKPIGYVFGVSPVCAVGVFLGMLCGFPVGAASIAQLYRDGSVDRESAERILPCCTNAGPAFLLSVAGAGVFGNRTYGWILLGIHLTASFLVGVTLRGSGYRSMSPVPEPKSQTAAAVFTESVQAAAVSMVQVSGFIVLFSVILSLMPACWPLAALLELTNGLTAIRETSMPTALLLPAVSAMLGWSGFCVHAQVLSFAAPLGLSGRRYLYGKMLHGCYAALLAVPVALLFRSEIPSTTAIHHPSSGEFFLTAAWALSAFCLFFSFLWKFRCQSVIIEKIRKGGG